MDRVTFRTGRASLLEKPTSECTLSAWILDSKPISPIGTIAFEFTPSLMSERSRWYSPDFDFTITFTRMHVGGAKQHKCNLSLETCLELTN